MGMENLPVPSSEEIEVSASYLRQIAKEFEKNLRHLEDRRWSTTLQDSLPNQIAFGDYQGGESFRNGTVTMAQNQIGTTIDQFISSYRGIIQSLRASADRYEQAEEKSKNKVRDAGNSGGSHTGPGPKLV
ncbi:hypothetical protein [Thermomonospora cellulosilytica]|uniref:Uncharacterized protein YukE n=1 Tax=Thermomonospora cellulosilytica TaxID=1411118 RepID=A0A7W3MWF8_9ACTN|nr:hypothetical protein [Thermomonospora cellulosilytica]MBA9003175.1 uncharacterized protein YukE [Thermomonospora cellulosilytica]